MKNLRHFTNHAAIGRFIVLNFIVPAIISVHALGASISSPQIKMSDTDDLARQLLEKFTDRDTKSIVVMDLEPAVGQRGSFGPWVSDQLSASLAVQAKTAEIVDRSKIAPALKAQHLFPPGQADVNDAIVLSRSIGATTDVVGSYGATENGIGITLVAFRVSYGVAQSTKIMVGMVFGTLPLTQQMSAHLNMPLDSLRPKDGIYRAGYGRVTIPSCVKCEITGMHVPDVDIAGMLRAHPQGATVSLQFVVAGEGRTRDITVVQPVGYGYDEQYVKMAQNFEFKPAVDADNKPVSVIFPFRTSFKFK